MTPLVFDKLRVTSCVTSSSSGTPLIFTVGTTNVLPSNANLVSVGFPTVIASKSVPLFEDVVFTGGSIVRNYIGSFSGVIDSTASTTVISGMTNTASIQVNDFITLNNKAQIGALGTVWAKVTNVASNSITVIAGTATNTVGNINFDVYRRGGFEKAGYSMYCVNSSTAARLIKYTLARLSLVNYSGGTAAKNLDFLIPTNVPIRVQFPDSLIDTNDILFSVLTQLAPTQATLLDALVKYTYEI